MNRPFRLIPQATDFLGRESELEALARTLLRHDVHMLTLTGPAGVGKTRLANETGRRVADAFTEGVIFVDLASSCDPDAVLATMAQQLGLRDTGDIPLCDRLRAHLREWEMLVILDNFEHVLEAAAQLPGIISDCPGITFLVTSRSPLQLQWEQTIPVPPLPVPDPDQLPPLEALAEVPSVALFLHRARARAPAFALTDENARLVAELCAQLDGLPLAIELAAARLNVLPLPLILQRLEDRLQLLHWNAHDLPARHRSLHAAITWSYDLLSAGEARLFRHLGVFAGQVSLEAIDAVVGNDSVSLTLEGMGSLAERSLVVSGWAEEDESFFGMLETMREYAWEQLGRVGELDGARQAHAQYFLELAERAAPELRQPQQRIWYLRLEREHDNLRTALRWLLRRGEYETALRLAGALGWFWSNRGYHAEGWRWLRLTLTGAPDAAPSLRIRALLMGGIILVYQKHFESARTVLEEALALARQSQDPSAIAQALCYLGGCAIYTGDATEGRRLLQEALRRGKELQDDLQIGRALTALGMQAFVSADYLEAAALFSNAVDRLRSAGDLNTASNVQFNLALALQRLGERDRAIPLVREALQASVAFQDRWQLCLGVEATVLLVGETIDGERKARLLGAGDGLLQTTGATSGALAQLTGQRVEDLRARLEQDGFGMAYREGRSLPLTDIVPLALEVLGEYAQTLMGSSTAAEGSPERVLSEREQAVLKGVAEGLTNRAIAQRLSVSPATVSYHLTSIFNKLAVNSRAHAVANAMQRHLL
jgi:non-specific serine/threonine protein kinase